MNSCKRAVPPPCFDKQESQTTTSARTHLNCERVRATNHDACRRKGGNMIRRNEQPEEIYNQSPISCSARPLVRGLRVDPIPPTHAQTSPARKSHSCFALTQTPQSPETVSLTLLMPSSSTLRTLHASSTPTEYAIVIPGSRPKKPAKNRGHTVPSLTFEGLFFNPVNRTELAKPRSGHIPSPDGLNLSRPTNSRREG